MWITNYIALVGWTLISIILFSTIHPQKAIIISTLGSFLFLPMSVINLPFIPPGLNKTTVVAFGIYLGEFFSRAKSKYPFSMKLYDLPMVSYCIIMPLMSSLLNGLGLYDGIAGIITKILTWGIFFRAGRKFFGSPSSIRLLTKAILLGGLIYVPFVFIEVNWGPILSTKIYGFFNHSLTQHIRYGGYRPIIFMPHGLVVSLWMCVTSIIAFWFWRIKIGTKRGKLSKVLIWIMLAGSTILCKSANGIVFMFLGFVAFYVYNRSDTSTPLKWLILIIPLYMGLRLSGILDPQELENILSKVFDSDRMTSFMFRIWQENDFGTKALSRPIFGWGRMGRAWPRNTITGEATVAVIDSFWIITLSCYGIFGLFSTYLSLGIGPLLILATTKKNRTKNGNDIELYKIDAVVLSIVVTIFLLDSLMNSSIPPIIIISSGALVSNYRYRKKNFKNMVSTDNIIELNSIS